MNLSIGALSRASGVPASTLRTWERRYGFPEPARTDGGQRLYAPDVVERVRLVAQGISLGHRPAQLIGAPDDALRRLCGLPGAVVPRQVVPDGLPAVVPMAGGVEGWVGYALALDGVGLDRAFRAELSRSGLERFLTDWVAPFLEALGRAWADGRLSPFHEHFAAERLRELLVDLWRPLAEANTGPTAVLTTLPAERHALGLHVAACHAASAGWRLVFLGVETPLPDIDACVRQIGASAVVVSVSASSNASQAAWDLASLRARLPAGVRLVVGGAGAPPTDAEGRPWPSLRAG